MNVFATKQLVWCRTRLLPDVCSALTGATYKIKPLGPAPAVATDASVLLGTGWPCHKRVNSGKKAASVLPAAVAAEITTSSWVSRISGSAATWLSRSACQPSSHSARCKGGPRRLNMGLMVKMDWFHDRTLAGFGFV